MSLTFGVGALSLEQYYYPLQLNVMDMLNWNKMDADVIDAASQTAVVKTYEVSRSSRSLLLQDMRTKLSESQVGS